MRAPERLDVWQGVGVAVVGAMSALTYMFAPQFPWLVPLDAGVCWLVGKLLGKPVDEVISAALARMKPDRAAAVTAKALQSMPPDRAAAVTAKALESMPPESTRTILRSIPPAVAQRVALEFTGASEPAPPPGTGSQFIR